MSAPNHKQVEYCKSRFDSLVIQEGNYGRIGLQHTLRGVPDKKGKHPGYKLYGVHGSSNRFPADPEWTKWLHQHGHFLVRQKQWFVPLHVLEQDVQSELEALLAEAVSQWDSVMEQRRDTYFQHYRDGKNKEGAEHE